MSKVLAVAKIRRDGGTQVRDAINEEHVERLRDVLAGGGAFVDPVVVFYDGESYWLADGFHRVTAAERAGQPQIAATVHRGTQRDAILHAVGANAKHGIPRSRADLHRAIDTLLRDAKWSKWSDRKIASVVGCSPPTIAARRRTTEKVFQSDERVGADGRTIDTANIGRAKPAPAAEAPPATEFDHRDPADAADEFDTTTPVAAEVFDATGEPARPDHSDADARPRDFGELDDGAAAERVIAACDAFTKHVEALLAERPLAAYRAAEYRDGVRGALLRVVRALTDHAKDQRPALGLIHGGK